jgi:hypothetical protein
MFIDTATSPKDKSSRGAKCCKRGYRVPGRAARLGWLFASKNIPLLRSCENFMEPVDYEHFVPQRLVFCD